MPTGRGDDNSEANPYASCKKGDCKMTNADTGIADPGTRPQSPADRAARRISGLRKNSLVISVAGLAAILGAAFSGASFVDHGHPGASMAMAVLTGAALLCYLLNLFTLSASPIVPRDHQRQHER